MVRVAGRTEFEQRWVIDGCRSCECNRERERLGDDVQQGERSCKTGWDEIMLGEGTRLRARALWRAAAAGGGQTRSAAGLHQACPGLPPMPPPAPQLAVAACARGGRAVITTAAWEESARLDWQPASAIRSPNTHLLWKLAGMLQIVVVHLQHAAAEGAARRRPPASQSGGVRVRSRPRRANAGVCHGASVTHAHALTLPACWA